MPYPSARPNDNMAIIALVIAIASVPAVSFFGIPAMIGGVVAVVLGLRSRGRIKRSGGALAGGGAALAACIVGLVAAVLGALWAIYLFALFMAMTSGGKGA